MTHVQDTADVIRILRDSKVIAVIGLHADGSKPAHYVPEYLHRQGYTILPVNPALVQRRTVFYGQRPYSTLTEIHLPVDIVQIFRRSDMVQQHLADILNMRPLPKVVWMQQGIRDEQTAATLREQGIEVIQDRCMLSDHRALM